MVLKFTNTKDDLELMNISLPTSAKTGQLPYGTDLVLKRNAHNCQSQTVIDIAIYHIVLTRMWMKAILFTYGEEGSN